MKSFFRRSKWFLLAVVLAANLAVGAHLMSGEAERAGAWNVGPSDMRPVTVKEVVDILSRHWEAPRVEYETAGLPEAANLQVDARRIAHELGVVSPWPTRRVLELTGDWYRDYVRAPSSGGDLVRAQLAEYRAEIAKRA